MGDKILALNTEDNIFVYRMVTVTEKKLMRKWKNVYAKHDEI